MRLLHFKNAAVSVVRDMEKNHTMAFAAASSYYFVVALFPFLIFLSAVGAQFNAELLHEARGTLAPEPKGHAEANLAA